MVPITFVSRPFRRACVIAATVFGAGLLLGSCVKDEELPRPTQTSYHGSFHDYKGSPVPGVKVMVYGQLYSNASGTLFGGRYKIKLLDSAVSDEAGEFRRSFTDPEDVNGYTFSTTNLEENLHGTLTKGQANSIALTTWRFFYARTQPARDP